MKQENVSIEKLKFVKRLALEFRLSLANICRILRIEPTEQNQKFIYDELLRKVSDGPDGAKEIEYLMYETQNEIESDSTVAYNMACLYFFKYVKARESGDSEQIEKASLNLRQTDIKFDKLIKNRPNKFSYDDYVTIMKYRIKHGLSQRQLIKIVEIHRETLKRMEDAIVDERLKRKVDCLNDYYEYLNNLIARNQKY